MSEEDIDEEVRRVLGLLYQDDTLRVLSALVLTGSADGSGLARDVARRALERLERGGLVSREDGGWRVRRERFRELLHATARPPAAPVSEEERVVRAFLVDGRLRAIPSRREKRLAVLHYIARAFEPGVRYPEREVDVVLRAFHDDYPALRRHLVVEGLMSRENNVYWRSGGFVEL
ncbi:hypothetical protein Sme01_56490 [Sphaerisporangium melleum]|uniref:DUF2087 domain-containing protein n=1 Tax=Sphaerisporangium melleum TaxID=321316 RepID=A0A917VPF7_9ACTN|nr:DUF2087 domain-containing protein [Sphaerisporangium melleum]GGL05701.1 hypothetical protein GCM10007964_54940 [Sphaerisporangium melleum]GII73173.1 hypothetical protein Sme01_56490 [Sphaerisporangium melleum]